jgi:hypothetical protein
MSRPSHPSWLGLYLYLLLMYNSVFQLTGQWQEFRVIRCSGFMARFKDIGPLHKLYTITAYKSSGGTITCTPTLIKTCLLAILASLKDIWGCHTCDWIGEVYPPILHVCYLPLFRWTVHYTTYYEEVMSIYLSVKDLYISDKHCEYIFHSI